MPVSAVSSAGNWNVLAGFSSNMGEVATLDDMVIMNGHGRMAYSLPIDHSVGITFQLNERLESKYSFVVALNNQKKLMIGQAENRSKGIEVVITSINNDNGLNATVVSYTTDGNRNVLGSIVANTPAMNHDHTIAFYEKGDKWCVALDGGAVMEVDSEKLGFDAKKYITAGAQYSVGDDYAQVSHLRNSISSVLVDDDVTTEYYGTGRIASSSTNGFMVVRGYGKTANTGKGLTATKGKTEMEGYGGIAYLGDSVSNAIAVDFEMNTFPQSGYFFGINLVNKAGVYYQPAGTESQGISTRVTALADGSGVSVAVWNITQAGYEVCGSISAKVSSATSKHTIAFYKEAGVWYVAIDGTSRMQLNVGVDLGDESYLCVGAAAGVDARETIKMSIYDIYIDGEVTDEMKSGTLKTSAVSTGASNGTSSYGPGGTSFNLDEKNAIIESVDTSVTPRNIVSSIARNLDVVQVIIISLMVICGCSLLVCVYRNKRLKKKDRQQEVNP